MMDGIAAALLALLDTPEPGGTEIRIRSSPIGVYIQCDRPERGGPRTMRVNRMIDRLSLGRERDPNGFIAYELRAISEHFNAIEREAT